MANKKDMIEEAFQTDIKQFTSGTFYINIPKEIIDKFNLERFDSVIIKICRDKPTFSSYKCKACLHVFDTSNQEPYCPACESLNLELLDGKLTQEEVEDELKKLLEEEAFEENLKAYEEKRAEEEIFDCVKQAGEAK